MSAKHTPGPWEIRLHGLGYIDIISDVRIVDGGYESYSGIATMNESDAQARADAALITAAPDLLQALRELLESEHPNRQYVNGHPAADKARAAIAKATGEAQ